MIPIFVEEKHAGFLIFGQYMIYGRNNDREVEQTSRMLGIPLDDLKKSFEMCRRLSDEDVEAVSQLLTVMLDGILAGKLIRVSKDDILNTILLHIASNLNGDLSSNELCRLFHLSHSELYSLFARIDQTPHAYVDKLRMKKAYDLLKNSTLSIQEICDEINFPNYTYFIRKFRNYCDVSPGRVRQMARKSAETETQTKE